MDVPSTPAEWNARGEGMFPGAIGVEVLAVEHGALDARLDVRRHHLAPNGYLHAATLIGLADTACGYGCVASLPEGATGFTTLELKTNFLGTALEGGIAVRARLAHGGRTTQVWDATVVREGDERTLALFRCTQLVLYR